MPTRGATLVRVWRSLRQVLLSSCWNRAANACQREEQRLRVRVGREGKVEYNLRFIHVSGIGTTLLDSEALVVECKDVFSLSLNLLDALFINCGFRESIHEAAVLVLVRDGRWGQLSQVSCHRMPLCPGGLGDRTRATLHRMAVSSDSVLMQLIEDLLFGSRPLDCNRPGAWQVFIMGFPSYFAPHDPTIPLL